jgi:hypothetical protein
MTPKAATWYQIHTNGGTHTLARYYEGQDATGSRAYVFEKMAVDTTTQEGSAELFGREEYTREGAAVVRLRQALEAAL